MLSKNKLNKPDENIDNTKTEDIDNTKTEYIDNTMNEDIDTGKTEDFDNTKTEDKDEDIYRGRNMFIQVFQHTRREKYRSGNWKKRQIVWVFWGDDHVSELCEKWIYRNHNYAYTRFEELRTCSGEVVFTREHKATTSKDKSDTYIDIDELQMFKDFSTKDKTTTKTKTKTKTMTKTGDKKILDKTNNKMDTINELNNGLAKIKAEITKKVQLIYEPMCELQDKIYSDDSWLKLVELGKIDTITTEALNVVWNAICGKNRISPEKIKIDKDKDIDGYVSKLTDVINDKIELVNRMAE